jgi:hypothetical protein
MAIGENIKASEYNAIRAKVIALLGTGTTTRGYGQPYQSSPVNSVTDTVTKQQWDELRYDIVSLKLHQDGLLPSVVTINTGDVIYYGAGHPNTNYNTLADSADANRFNIGTGQFALSSVAQSSTTSSWVSSATCELTVTFSTSEDARLFFNSGGQIRISGTRTGGAGTAQNGAWSSALLAMGNLPFKASTGTETNFYNLTNSWKQLHSFTLSTPYSSNNILVEIKCDIADNSLSGAKILYFRITLTDGYFEPTQGQPGNPLPNDTVDGTLTFNVEELVASGNLTPSGTFTVPTPASYSLSSITVS